jgi:hypothetical protein
MNKNYFSCEYTKPILITGIIFLISHMFITWDDNISSMDNEIIDIPKYRFPNNLDNNKIQGEIIAANTNLPNTNLPNTNLPNTNLPNQNASDNPSVLPPTQSLNSKYRIVNKYNTLPQKTLNNIANNYSYDNSKLSNQNIFISHKNSSKYGLKY